MNDHTFWNSFFPCILLFAGCIILQGFSAVKAEIVIETSYFRYEISSDGKNLHFFDQTDGKDYLSVANISYCTSIVQNGKQFHPTTASLNGHQFQLEFGSANVTVGIQILQFSDRVLLKVKSITGTIESLTFLNIPLSLEGMPYEPFAACALSMNLFTHVRQIPALQNHLWATGYRRFGLEGAEVMLIGTPPAQMLPVIREVMSNAKAIPFSDKGGAWALQQPEGYGSYLMNFGTLTEATVDEWITMCHNLGFNQIDNHGGGDFFRFGDFELNPAKWPDGWQTFRRINDRLHAAGISAIFHTYAFFIDKNSGFVTPTPSPDLAFFNQFALAEPLAPADSELVVLESTANISTITGFFVRNSLTLRIGNELIEFTGVTQTPPYKFTGCKRGANGTTAGAFEAGEKIFHLREMFGRFVPDPETALFEEIAKRTAGIVSDCGFDGIYFDAIDGSDILGGEENFWYYGSKFIFEVARHLKRPVGMEMSSMSHHWWHYRSRWQAWDRPVRGYKRFIDIHLAAIKSTRLFLGEKIKANENEHGLWRGHAPLIDKYAGVENGGLLLPLHLGWWGNQTWNPPQIEPTFPDDIEYLCCKMIGNNAGLSMLGGVDEKNLAANPLFRRLVGIIQQYETLRHDNYFDESVRARLREPGKEFTLIQENGAWNFKPIAYQKHKVAGLNHPSARWTVFNEFEAQPVKLRIEPLMAVKPFDDSANVVLADFSRPDEFSNAGNAEGVSGGIHFSAEKSVAGEVCGIFSAETHNLSPREGLWLKMEKQFEPWLNLQENQGLGVWINGDGNGQLLNLRIESPKHLSHGARGDHFVKIDFTGWKYFELVEIESAEFSNYIWPDSGFYVYDSFRHTVCFDKVDKLQLWYNNLPSGKAVNCALGPIKALPLAPVQIVNPGIEINGASLILPVKLESGMVLEFRSANDCKLYGSKGELLQEVLVQGNVPELQPGENEISFFGDGPGNSRIQVTVISEGKPLNKKW